MSPGTSDKPKSLQRPLYRKAKREPLSRFHFLYDKVWRTDVLARAHSAAASPAAARRAFAGPRSS